MHHLRYMHYLRFLARFPRIRGTLLAALLALTVAGCSGSPSTAASSTRQTPVTTPTVVLASPVATTPTPTRSGTPSTWQQYQDPIYGFTLDIPGYLTPQSTDGFGRNGHSEMWQGQDNAGGSSHVIDVIIAAASQIKAADCMLQGTPMSTPITIGQGISGVQFGTYAAPPPPAGEMPPPLHINASFIANGVYVMIELDGSPPSSTFMQRYGAIWSHMLASVRLGPAVAGTQPCS